MNTQEKQILKTGLIFESFRGNKSIGNSVIDGYDLAKVGIYIQEDSDILGLNYIPQIVDENDVYYEIRKFLEIAMKGNPSVLEVFNMDDQHTLYSTPYFEYLKQHSNIFDRKVKDKDQIKKVHNLIISIRNMKNSIRDI